MNDPKIIASFSIFTLLVAGVIIFQLLDYTAFKDALQQASEEQLRSLLPLVRSLSHLSSELLLGKKSYRQ